MMWLKTGLILLWALGNAEAATIFTAFGSGDTFSLFGGYQLGGGALGSTDSPELAVTFTPAIDYTLDQIRIALFAFGQAQGDRDLVLDLSQGPLPGTPIETFSTTVNLGGGGSIYSFDSTLHPELSAGQRYWIVVSSNDLIDNSFAWNFSVTTKGDLLERTPGMSLWQLFYLASPAFDVSGTPVATASTPEPGTMVFVSSGLLALGLWPRRMRFRARG